MLLVGKFTSFLNTSVEITLRHVLYYHPAGLNFSCPHCWLTLKCTLHWLLSLSYPFFTSLTVLPMVTPKINDWHSKFWFSGTQTQIKSFPKDYIFQRGHILILNFTEVEWIQKIYQETVTPDTHNIRENQQPTNAYKAKSWSWKGFK